MHKIARHGDRRPPRRVPRARPCRVPERGHRRAGAAPVRGGGAAGPRTKLIACSHVSWVNGRVIDTNALAEAPAQVLLDGAQGLGAMPVRAADLRCDWYAASGQKWLCGPDASGYLFAAAQLVPPWPGYGSLEDAQRPLDFELHPDARRYDMGIVPPAMGAGALSSLQLL